ncbi:MAG TPA: 3,4-dihydroxy-2-butanone-4-phosphate synthase [Hadesarchaea archaeon]|nr:3,4-dihydroxy-2-butanone-4-phosphate synthase [Hadesarchaea archaeon]
MSLERALEDLSAGKFVLLYDSEGRENEIDMIIAAEFVGPSEIATMRREAGGLICVALHPTISKNFGLPYLAEVYNVASSKFDILTAVQPNDIPYDERSAFSLAVNHRRTFTGIIDVDRALTIQELGRVGRQAFNGTALDEFGKNFRSPGHVPLLRAADELLNERRGHTELSVVLAELAGVTPVVAVCEMLDTRTNRALSKEAAKEYAKGRGLILLDGLDVVAGFQRKEKNETSRDS